MKEKIDSFEKQRNNQDSFEKLRSLASQDEAEKPQIAAESSDPNDFEPMPKLDSD